jgi:DNA-binding MarR family transcriptional regulator
MDIHQSTASNLAKGLIQRGMATATRDGADRRSVALWVSPAGTEVLARAPMPFAGVLPDALASLDAATLARLEQDLGKVIGLVAADEASAKVLLADM